MSPLLSWWTESPVSEGHHFPQNMKWDRSGKLDEEEKANRAGARDRTWVAIKILNWWQEYCLPTLQVLWLKYNSPYIVPYMVLVFPFISLSAWLTLICFKILSDFYLWVFFLSFFVLHVTYNSLNLFHIVLCSCSGLIKLNLHLVSLCFTYLICTQFCFKQIFIVSLVSDFTPLT